MATRVNRFDPFPGSEPVNAESEITGHIEIVQRQVVYTVPLFRYGGVSPIDAAFTAASAYIREHISSEPIHLEFDLDGRMFHASVDPDTSV